MRVDQYPPLIDPDYEALRGRVHVDYDVDPTPAQQRKEAVIAHEIKVKYPDAKVVQVHKFQLLEGHDLAGTIVLHVTLEGRGRTLLTELTRHRLVYVITPKGGVEQWKPEGLFNRKRISKG